jgi:hypothetical protein
MESNISAEKTPQKPLVVVLEYHSAGAPVVGGEVQVTQVSLYMASGVSAGDVFGLSDMAVPGAAYVRLAERLDRADAEALANALADRLSRSGIPVELRTMYDE